MANVIKKFPMIERAIREILLRTVPSATGRVGSAPAYQPGAAPFIWIQLGNGKTDATEGDWVIDIDVLCDSYSKAMDQALDIESVLLVGRLMAPETGMLVDSVYQNVAPRQLPWDDEGVFRVGATYAVSARRTG